MSRFAGPVKLGTGHSLAGFDSGLRSLDSWLTGYAPGAAGAGSAMTYVIDDREQGRVIGYHAITVASIDHHEATERARRGMPRHAIPAVLLARLAVDRSVQGRGIGALLLGDAMRRSLSIADQVGIRLMLAHAVDTEAQRFYLRFGFEPSPVDPMNVQILMKDVRRSLDESAPHRTGRQD